MEEKILSPCPFCGGEDLEMVFPYQGIVKIIVCKSCAAQGPPEELRIAAKNSWNRRVSIVGKIDKE